MEYILLYPAGSIVTLFLVKIINKYIEPMMKLRLNEAVTLLLLSWFGSFIAILYFMHYVFTRSYNRYNSMHKFFESFRKWIEGD